MYGSIGSVRFMLWLQLFCYIDSLSLEFYLLWSLTFSIRRQKYNVYFFIVLAAFFFKSHVISSAHTLLYILLVFVLLITREHVNTFLLCFFPNMFLHFIVGGWNWSCPQASKVHRDGKSSSSLWNFDYLWLSIWEMSFTFWSS